MTPSERLRAAAQLARETAEAAPERFSYMSSGGWPGELEKVVYISESCTASIAVEDGAKNAEEIATHYMLWSPPVALAVAAWLETFSTSAEKGHLVDRAVTDAALAFTDALLSGTSEGVGP